MKHLSTDERLALIEAAGQPRHPHLAVCEACRLEIAAARAVLADARAARAPEPSPLFWEHFSARVSAGLDDLPDVRSGRWRMPWRMLIPLTAGVMLLLVLVVTDRGRPLVPPPPPVVRDAASGTAAASPGDEGWKVLGHMAGDFDVDTLRDALGSPVAAGADAAVWQLNDEERAELTRLLQTEMRGGGSGS